MTFIMNKWLIEVIVHYQNLVALLLPVKPHLWERLSENQGCILLKNCNYIDAYSELKSIKICSRYFKLVYKNQGCIILQSVNYLGLYMWEKISKSIQDTVKLVQWNLYNRKIFLIEKFFWELISNKEFF